MTNPLAFGITFEVIVSGEGLIGPTSFYLEANESKLYSLVYSPLYVGRAKGSIAFINEHLGEKWYELVLNSEEQPVVKLTVLKTELGKSSSKIVCLENPSDKEVKAISKCSNP